ncbi:MBL fold metallo-hydrolase [Romboutsia weinsteinii]|uniref:MBL fold metallo-hydrolase n=1 Tax=Romboutsia weinsteinii TaxID=2020949 RepID=A0A371J2J8_9FIRM|nr:MBL fold metallo-hydrolase [Romboutsia weinsteinii]RDY27009.1 MBL fold metallo-hydrolase [Romboutsia weinsteinii]
MKITYIHHSCFSVELDSCTLLFDYFKGKLPEFNKDKKLYVFSSHSHHDHFDKIIFDLEKTYPNITYILSDDIKNTESDSTRFIGANERILIDNLQIKTLESSDLGVAFLVKVDNKSIYHAGDLNWWHWEGENTPEQNEFAENKYKSAIDKIKGENIDLAFVPLDSRQGKQYYLGFDYFMKNTNTKAAFPMHFWRTYSLVKILKDSENALSYRDKVFEINKEGQLFEIK